MEKKSIAVLFGGASSEYQVSLQSAFAVLNHMNHEKYNIVAIGISEDGNWYKYEGSYDAIADDSWMTEKKYPLTISLNRQDQCFIVNNENTFSPIHVDAVFPVLHGKNGEDGSVQGLLELVGLPIIGCKTLASSLCMDKDRSHKLVEAHGIAVPASVLLDCFDQIESQVSTLQYPLFVKPLRAGSSMGISKVDQASELLDAIAVARQYDSKVLVEEMIEGFEVGCAIVGNDALIVGRVDEIFLTNGFFDFTEKYTLKSSKIYMPARITKEQEKKIQETGKAIYIALGCSGFARVDMFLTPEHTIVFNEVNTIPGFTAHSRFPNMMKGIGIDFSELIEKLIQQVIE